MVGKLLGLDAYHTHVAAETVRSGIALRSPHFASLCRQHTTYSRTTDRNAWQLELLWAEEMCKPHMSGVTTIVLGLRAMRDAAWATPRNHITAINTRSSEHIYTTTPSTCP